MTPREVIALLACVRVARADMQEQLARESHRTLNEDSRLEYEAWLAQSSESQGKIAEINMQDPLPPRTLGPFSLHFEAHQQSLEQQRDELRTLERLRDEWRTFRILEDELQILEQLPDVPSLAPSTPICCRLRTLST